MSLPDILKAARVEDARFMADIPETWMQGRTGYGGLTAALALEAVLRAYPDLPPLRSAQIAFVGPAAGTVEVTTTLLRRGRTAGFVEAVLSCEGKLCLKALFVFMIPLESHVDFSDNAAPDVPSPEAAEPVKPHPDPTFFTRNLDYRFAAPKTDAPTPDWLRWGRLVERDGLHPMVEMMAIGDALPPAAMAVFDRQGPISSMTWMINFLTAEPVTRDGWWLMRSSANHARNGASNQAMHVWNADGQPVASGMQSVALFV